MLAKVYSSCKTFNKNLELPPHILKEVGLDIRNLKAVPSSSVLQLCLAPGELYAEVYDSRKVSNRAFHLRCNTAG